MLAVRAFVFTTYIVPSGIGAGLGEGDLVVVNRLSHALPQRGEVIVYQSGDDESMGRVIAVPGDTIRFEGKSFVIPDIVQCKYCGSTHCRHYLVVHDNDSNLVHQTHIVGCVRLLFRNQW